MAAESISNRRGKKGKHPQHQELGHEFGENDDRSTDSGQTLGEAAEAASDYISEGVSHLGERLKETTHGREGTVVMAALAVGFGVGIALGTSLAGPRHRPRSWYDRSAAEGIGRRVMERLEEMLPHGIADCLGK